MNSLYLLLLLITALLNSAVQLLLKVGAPIASSILSGSGNLFTKVIKTVFNPYILGAVLVLFGGMFLWLKIISKIDLTIAYPANIALTILFTSVAAVFLLGESFTLFRFLGVVFIAIGLFFLLSGKNI